VLCEGSVTAGAQGAGVDLPGAARHAAGALQGGPVFLTAVEGLAACCAAHRMSPDSRRQPLCSLAATGSLSHACQLVPHPTSALQAISSHQSWVVADSNLVVRLYRLQQHHDCDLTCNT
jgi:hypothetical protein